MFLSFCDKEVRNSAFHTPHTNFAFDHPIEEVGRQLSAVLLKHNSLTPQLIEIIEQGKFVKIIL